MRAQVWSLGWEDSGEKGMGIYLWYSCLRIDAGEPVGPAMAYKEPDTTDWLNTAANKTTYK